MLGEVLVIVDSIECRRIIDGERGMGVLTMQAFLISIDPI
jgi:hypothetical protein